jgi:hypothetical protein
VDITYKAHEYIQDIPVTLVYVKSHQDENKDTESLTFDAQMNITADALATQQRESMAKPVTEVKGSCDAKKWIIKKKRT